MQLVLSVALVLCTIATTQAQLLTSTLFRIFTPIEIDVECRSVKTLTVQGSATLQVTPDVAILTVQLAAVGENSQEAIRKLESQIKKMINMLKDNQITEDQYQTTSLILSTNQILLKGVQRDKERKVSQKMKIMIPIATQDYSTISAIVDQLANFGSITLLDLSFDISNPKVALMTAKEEAFKKAKQKAKDFAQAANLRMGKLLAVRDKAKSVLTFQSSNKKCKFSRLIPDDQNRTATNQGNIGVLYQLEVIFAFA